MRVADVEMTRSDSHVALRGIVQADAMAELFHLWFRFPADHAASIDAEKGDPFLAACLAELRGLPRSITVDHGPEFEGQALDAWAYKQAVRLAFIRPGKPIENAYVELQRPVSR